MESYLGAFRSSQRYGSLGHIIAYLPLVVLAMVFHTGEKEKFRPGPDVRLLLV
jgi:hypothetical protein